jgi:hypothetical protein
MYRADTALCLALAVAAASARAQSDPIVTDRPDFVESSNVVGKGKVQIETSFALERDRAAGGRSRVASTPTLIRIGVSDTMEWRLETDGPTVARTQDGDGTRTTRRGMADVALGAKWHVRDGAGRAPSLGLLAHLELDSGNAAVRGNGVRPSLRLVAEWELPGAMSLGVMPGVSVGRDADGRRFTGALFGAVLGKSWSERWRTYAEVSVPQLAPGHGGVQASFDVGAACLLSGAMQIDAALARGLNARTPDLSWTMGLSVKF